MFFFSCGTCRAKSCKQAVRAGLQYKEKVTTGTLLSRTKGKKLRDDYNDDNNNDNTRKKSMTMAVPMMPTRCFNMDASNGTLSI